MPSTDRSKVVKILVFIGVVVLVGVFFIMLSRDESGEVGLSARTPVAQAQSHVAARIRPGMDLKVARDLATAMGFEMADIPNEKGVLFGIIRGSGAGLNPVSRSLQVQIVVGDDQRVIRAECFEGFTGP
jgi:hypothetical protein